MRISDWSADVCSSDLSGRPAEAVARNIEDGGREIAEILDFRHSIPHLAVRPKRPTGVHVSPSGMWVPALRGFAAPAGMREDEGLPRTPHPGRSAAESRDRKSTRLNSSH